MTEWPEGVDAGKNFLVGNTKENIIRAAMEFIRNPEKLEDVRKRPFKVTTGVSRRCADLVKGLFDSKQIQKV